MTRPSIRSQIEAVERSILTLDMTIKVQAARGDKTVSVMETDWLPALRMALETLKVVETHADDLRALVVAARMREQKNDG